MTGKEARYVLRQRRVSLTDLASRLGISPQALGSRLNEETFSHSRQLEINKVMGEDIFDVSVPLIDRYMSPKTGHLLDIPDNRYRSTLNYIDLALNRTADLLGIDRHVSYYTARKSFVQHGFELGIPLETLEYCIGQTMKQNRPIFNYVKIMRQHADAAIRKILDNVRPPQPSQAEEVGKTYT